MELDPTAGPREMVDRNDLPQEIDDSVRTEATSKRLEEAILRVADSASSQFWEANVQATSPKSRLIRTLTFVASTWVVFFAIGSMATLMVGWVVFEVSPFHTLERIAYEQDQARYEQTQQDRENAQTNAKKVMGAYHVDLGNRLLNVGQARAADAEFEKALKLDPLNVKAQMGSLKCELFESVEEEDYNLAVIQPKLNKLAREQPDDTHVYAFRGTVNYLAGKLDRALWNYEEAVSLDDSNAYAYDGMASVYFERGDIDKGLGMSERAYDLAPRNPIYKHNYANALYASGRYDDAIQQYSGVISWDWKYMWSYHDLAQLYRLKGELESSQWYYEQFIAMLEDEEITSLRRNQGGASFTTGEGSYPVYLPEVPEQRYYAYYSLALTSYLRGRTEEAETYVSEAKGIQIDPYVESEIERLMQYDIVLLLEEQEQFNARAESFRDTFL